MHGIVSGVTSESEWCDFFGTRPKVLRALGEYELEAHDLYMQGKVTLTDVFLFTKGEITWSELNRMDQLRAES